MNESWVVKDVPKVGKIYRDVYTKDVHEYLCVEIKASGGENGPLRYVMERIGTGLTQAYTDKAWELVG